jgi:hypothetical protein
MEFNFTVEHRAGRANSNVDPLLCNPIAVLPREMGAGELNDFRESAAPKFETQDPPTHPTVRVASVVAEDVDSSEGIKWCRHRRRTTCDTRGCDLSTIGDTSGCAKQSARGIPHHVSGMQTASKAPILQRWETRDGVSMIHGLQMDLVHLWHCSVRSRLDVMELSQTPYRKSPRSTTTPYCSPRSWSSDTWTKHKRGYSPGRSSQRGTTGPGSLERNGARVQNMGKEGKIPPSHAQRPADVPLPLHLALRLVYRIQHVRFLEALADAWVF